MNSFDICIIGGGASGMAAAIEASLDCPECRIVIIDKNEALGKKLRATGNGRCNLTNTDADGYTSALNFLRSIGIAVRVYPNGLVYPYSESASDVVELLAAKIRECEVTVLTESTVKSVSKDEGESNHRFEVLFEKKDEDGTPMDKKLKAKTVIIATGGKAGPNLGATGDGYNIAKSFGHEIIKPIPVLVPVECEKEGTQGYDSNLSGIRAKGRVSLYRKGENVFSEDGEIQFTRFGLSGIAIFNMTRFMRFESTNGIMDFEIGLNLFPNGNLAKYIEERREDAIDRGSSSKVDTLLETVFKEVLAKYVLKRAGLDFIDLIRDISDDEIERIVNTAQDLRFTPLCLKGWKDAQAMSGGVSLDEIDIKTTESKIVEGLYITGEVANYDGPCGGFNLNNAWVTGALAGRAIKEKLFGKE